MVLLPLPDEHIYSYLYRGYRVHGVLNAMRTIINSEGKFRQRLGFIKYEYIQSFVPDIPEIPDDFFGELMLSSFHEEQHKYLWWNKLLFPVMRRSGFLSANLKGHSAHDVVNGMRQPGLKFCARDPE